MVFPLWRARLWRLSLSGLHCLAIGCSSNMKHCGKRFHPSLLGGGGHGDCRDVTGPGMCVCVFKRTDGFCTKRTGGFCHIINLSSWNTYLCIDKFCTETLFFILQGLHNGWWMVSLDLKDAYLHVHGDPSQSLARSFYSLICSQESSCGAHYQWKVLPFSLATCPIVFTKLLAPVAARRNVSCILA